MKISVNSARFWCIDGQALEFASRSEEGPDVERHFGIEIDTCAQCGGGLADSADGVAVFEFPILRQEAAPVFDASG
mgnify:CR=1 FL=1